VFVDEAGHGWEPEVVAAFAGLLDVNPSTASGQLILAGDPQQLGPIVRSNAVDDSHGGLSISLLERLITTHAAYRRDPDVYPTTAGYDPRVLTMLLNCYRCHPDILKLPNDLFYASLLVPAADRLTTHNLCNWPGLPTRNFPLIFHGIEGENVREANSPSWFNVAEVEQVWEYVKDLVDVHGVPASEVAVIAPYHKQVMKITQLLRAGANRGRYNDIAVGSCEKMQGQERRVIIISAVRSSAEFLDADRYYNLGFVASPKRFNVAVTRAKALLIVIGNPNVLARDPCWGGLLNMCVARGGYRGCALSSNDPNAGPGGPAGPDSGPGGEGGGGGPSGENGAGDGAWSSDDEDGAPGGGAGAVHFAGAAPPAVGLQQLEEDLARLALAAAPAPSLNIPLLSQRGAGAAAQQVHGAAAFAEDDGADAAEGWERVDEVDWARTEL
jgi:helicase MOV-10